MRSTPFAASVSDHIKTKVCLSRGEREIEERRGGEGRGEER
jgi:hypothetical protein